MNPIAIQVSITGSKDDAWTYYTQAEHITQWNFASADWHCPHATTDLRAGGRYLARMEARDGSQGFDFEAIYDEVVPGTRLRYTLMDGRRVSVTFTEHGDHTLVDVVFDPETTFPLELQQAGWQAILNQFKGYAESRAH